MAVIDIIPGVKVYQAKNYSVLFGCPPEVIKHLMVRKIPFPDYIVLPDTMHHYGVLQNATEFPFYNFLFIEGHFFKGRRLNIVGSKQSVANNRDLLRLSLLGPTMAEYRALGNSPYFEQLYRESRSLSLKDKSGREIPIDDFVNFIHYKDSEITTEYFSLKHTDRNEYAINGTLIDINFDERQQPPYDLKPDYVPILPAKFSVDVLGGASGFAATNPCSGVVLNHNSNYMLIDCMLYLDYALNARGISGEQIKSIFLTHIHDDHCNIFPLVLFNNHIKLLATKEIFWMACKKLSLMTGHEIAEFESLFEFVELLPYTPTQFFGLTITPHYTVHSIPTIGASFEMRYTGENHRIVFVGDNKSLSDIDELHAQGIVSDEKHANLNKLYKDRHNLFFADGGQGILHGDPRDSLESQADRVIFLHLEKLPPEFDTTFTLASHGKRFILEEASDKAFLIQTMQILMRHYPGISDEWETALLGNVRLIKYNTGDVIMKQGDKRNGVIYVILSGNVSVLHHDGQALCEVGTKQAGEIIGDMAVVNDVNRRSASIVARIPVVLCEIQEDLFYSFLKAENRIEELQQMWLNRHELESHYPFSELGDVVNTRLATAGRRLAVHAGRKIIEQGDFGREFYIVLSGRFAIIRDGKIINRIGPGSMFGEYGSLTARMRNATVQSLDNGVLLIIDKDAVAHIIQSTPALSFHLHQIFQDREESNLVYGDFEIGDPNNKQNARTSANPTQTIYEDEINRF